MWVGVGGCGVGKSWWARSPSSALLHFFEGGGEINYRKKGTLILTSLLEDLVGVGGRGWVWGREKLEQKGYPYSNLSTGGPSGCGWAWVGVGSGKVGGLGPPVVPLYLFVEGAGN